MGRADLLMPVTDFTFHGPDTMLSGVT
jgi:hypothetical protein